MLVTRDTDYNGHDALFMYDKLDSRIGTRASLTVLFEDCQFHEGPTQTNGPVPAIGTVVTPEGPSFWVFEDWSLRAMPSTQETL